MPRNSKRPAIRQAGDKVTEPGLYTMPAPAYHKDPCPQPSLSASVALPLLHRSPRHAWWRHPRLNPQFEERTEKRFDLGAAAHTLLLQAGRDLRVIDADSYRGKAAQTERDAAHAAGHTPILADDYERAKDMAKAARLVLDRELGSFLESGLPETVLVWREDEAWCRSMFDLASTDLCTIVDYKTTAASANPPQAERLLYNMGYHFKAGFYERGLDVLDPSNIGRRRFLFLFQEVEPTYEASVLEPDPGGMTIARKQITAAIQLWQRCIESGQWPGYPPGIHKAFLPGWAEQAWLNREMTDPNLTGALSPDGDRPTHDPTEQPYEGWTP